MNPVSKKILLWMAASLAIGTVMITSQSLWIDEGQTYHFAKQPDFEAWRLTLSANTKSEAQMPLAMLYAWAGAEVVGQREWQLRVINLPWLALGAVAMGLLGQRVKTQFPLAIFLLHPFVWFYVNEARPYAMQICAGAWLLYLLVKVQHEGHIETGDAWVFLFASILGYGSSLLFAFPLAAFTMVLVLVCWSGNHRPKLAGAPLALLAIAGLFLAGLTVYYLNTLQRGASGARLWSVSPLNLLFATYELLGFSGLGIPRFELRELARTPSALLGEIFQWRYAGLLCLSAVYAVAFVNGWRIRREPVFRIALAFALATAIALFAGAAVARFPFWGRHLAPILGGTALLAALAVSGPTRIPRWHKGVVASLLLVGLLSSSLMLRFSARHQKDDYRTAVILARQALAAGRIVWWSADREECAEYYQLPIHESLVSNRLVICVQATKDEIVTWPEPDLIFQSKPDVFDGHGTLAALIHARQYRLARRFPAFSVWSRPGFDAEFSAQAD
jgi:hypothetical protein